MNALYSCHRRHERDGSFLWTCEKGRYCNCWLSSFFFSLLSYAQNRIRGFSLRHRKKEKKEGIYAPFSLLPRGSVFLR